MTYYLKEKATAKVSVTIADPFGKELSTAEGPGKAGLSRFVWEPRQAIAPGAYVVTLKVGETPRRRSGRASGTSR